MPRRPWPDAYAALVLPIAGEVSVKPSDDLASPDAARIVNDSYTGADANWVSAVECDEFPGHPANQEPKAIVTVRARGGGGSTHNLLPHLLHLRSHLGSRVRPIISEKCAISRHYKIENWRAGQVESANSYVIEITM